MISVYVVYDTKYGNTKLVAEKIAEGLREVKEIETVISDVEEVDLGKVADSDVILLGAPNHMGSPPRTIRKFIDMLKKLDLRAKWFAVFDTYLGGDFEKAAKKMEKEISEKVPSLKLITSCLSIKVGGMKGPIVEGELSKCKDFGNKIAKQFKSTT